MKTILIVDDEELIHQTLKNIIELKFDHSVLTASSGTEGLELFKKNKPDLVITDIRMPGKDGLWLVDQIREIDSSVPIILMSGFSSATPNEIDSRPHQGFFRKPDDMKQVIDLISSIL